MKQHLLKAILGKFICASRRIAYCHIDRIIVMEGKQTIATAIAKTLDGRILHWFLEAEWSTDRYGVHEISYYKILKEDELDGYATQKQTI